MKSIFIKELKSFFYKKKVLLISSILITLICITGGYAILRARLDFNGIFSVSGEKTDENEIPKIYQKDIDFVKTGGWGNTFVYDIIIPNNSSITHEELTLKIYDTGYIVFPSWFTVSSDKDGWILTASEENSVVEESGTLKVSITFDVIDNLEDSMSIYEYADYFVRNFIVVSGSNKPKTEQGGTIIENGNAKLTLEQFEKEVKSFTIERNLNYISTIQNEKQYILTINNQTTGNYRGVRANIYYGLENQLESITPTEIIYEHDTNCTIETPIWVQIEPNGKTLIYINIILEDENFVPDVVVAALIDQN